MTRPDPSGLKSFFEAVLRGRKVTHAKTCKNGCWDQYGINTRKMQTALLPQWERGPVARPHRGITSCPWPPCCLSRPWCRAWPMRWVWEPAAVSARRLRPVAQAWEQACEDCCTKRRHQSPRTLRASRADLSSWYHRYPHRWKRTFCLSLYKYHLLGWHLYSTVSRRRVNRMSKRHYETGLRPWIRRIRISTIATTRRMWMNPPSV